MKCLTPRRLPHLNERLGEYRYWLPCGSCDICLRERQKEWCVRLMCELSTMKGYAKFITLTYDDENLPDYGNLKFEDVQRYFKRVRKNSKDYLKYFVAGEYGEEGFRPHYHSIIFHNDVDTVDNLKEDWKMGNVDIGRCELGSVRYVLKYIDKQKKSKYHWLHNGLNKPFQKMSKGIGLDYLNKYRHTLLKGYIILDGYKYKIPKYFLKKDEELKEHVMKLYMESERGTKEDDIINYNDGYLLDQSKIEETFRRYKQVKKNINALSDHKKRKL